MTRMAIHCAGCLLRLELGELRLLLRVARRRSLGLLALTLLRPRRLWRRRVQIEVARDLGLRTEALPFGREEVRVERAGSAPLLARLRLCIPPLHRRAVAAALLEVLGKRLRFGSVWCVTCWKGIQGAARYSPRCAPAAAPRPSRGRSGTRAAPSPSPPPSRACWLTRDLPPTSGAACPSARRARQVWRRLACASMCRVRTRRDARTRGGRCVRTRGTGGPATSCTCTRWRRRGAHPRRTRGGRQRTPSTRASSGWSRSPSAW